MTVDQLIEELQKLSARGDGWREVRYARFNDAKSAATRIDYAEVHGGAVVLTPHEGCHFQ